MRCLQSWIFILCVASKEIGKKHLEDGATIDFCKRLVVLSSSRPLTRLFGVFTSRFNVEAQLKDEFLSANADAADGPGHLFCE